MKLTHSAISNLVGLLTEKVLGLVFAAVVGIFVARYLGPKEYGSYSYVRNIIVLTSFIGALGIEKILIMELVKERRNPINIVFHGFILRSIGGMLQVCMVLLIFTLSGTDDFQFGLILIMSLVSIVSAFEVIGYFFQSLLKSKYLAFSKIIAIIISGSLKLFFIYINVSLFWFGVAFFIEYLIYAICLCVFYRKMNEKISKSYITISKGYLLTILKYSIPLAFISLVTTIYMKIDIVMIRYLIDLEAVGEYVAASRLSEILYFVPVALSATLFPELIKDYKKNENEGDKKLRSLIFVLFVIALLLTVLLALASNHVIIGLYGKEYSNSIDVFLIHVCSLIFVFIGNPVKQVFAIRGLLYHSLLITAIASFVNIGLNFYLIPIMGIKGAAYATLIAYSLGSFGLNFALKSTRKYALIQVYSILNFRRNQK